jgi:Chromo (CHRromatin Organisation MOdifier) domain
VIEAIDDHRVNSDLDKLEFFVKWEGFGLADRTWEPFEMFAYDAPEVA